MSITLRRIRSFIGVAEHGSFRRAAEHLAISQPALSAHIQDLEEEIGVPLLRRTTRLVSLTDEGQRFAERIKPALSAFETVIDDLKEYAAIQRGQVSVACVPSVASQILPSLLAKFRDQQPNIIVQIYDDRAEVVEERVENGDVDFAISPPPARNSDLTFESIIMDPYLAVLPKSHPLADQSCIDLEDFIQYPLILMRAGLNMRQVFDEAVARAKLKPGPTYEVYNHDTLIAMVAAGLGIGAMPALTLTNIHHPALVFRALSRPLITRKIGLLTRRGEQLSPVAKKFASALKRHLRKQVSSAPAV